MKSLQESIMDIDKNVTELDKRAEFVTEWRLSTKDWVKKHKKDLFEKWVTYVEPDTIWGDPGVKERQYMIGYNKKIREFNRGTGYLYSVVLKNQNGFWSVLSQIKPDKPTRSNLDQQVYEKSDYQIMITGMLSLDEAIEYAEKAIQLFSIMAEVNPDQLRHEWNYAGALDGEEGEMTKYTIRELTLDII